MDNVVNINDCRRVPCKQINTASAPVCFSDKYTITCLPGFVGGEDCYKNYLHVAMCILRQYRGNGRDYALLYHM